MKQRILQLIEEKIEALNREDVIAHIWWNHFKELVLALEEETVN